jgi:hypothetical protein
MIPLRMPNMLRPFLSRSADSLALVSCGAAAPVTSGEKSDKVERSTGGAAGVGAAGATKAEKTDKDKKEPERGKADKDKKFQFDPKMLIAADAREQAPGEQEEKELEHVEEMLAAAVDGNPCNVTAIMDLYTYRYASDSWFLVPSSLSLVPSKFYSCSCVYLASSAS